MYTIFTECPFLRFRSYMSKHTTLHVSVTVTGIQRLLSVKAKPTTPWQTRHPLRIVLGVRPSLTHDKRVSDLFALIK